MKQLIVLRSWDSSQSVRLTCSRSCVRDQHTSLFYVHTMLNLICLFVCICDSANIIITFYLIPLYQIQIVQSLIHQKLLILVANVLSMVSVSRVE